MKDFKMQSINYSFNFNTINDIQQRYMKNSHILERINFNNPMIIPNAPNMPVEMPVVIIKHDFRDIQLIIRRENLSLIIPYTEGFEEFADPYILTVCDFLEIIMDISNIKYIGCAMSYILEENSAIEF